VVSTTQLNTECFLWPEKSPGFGYSNPQKHAESCTSSSITILIHTGSDQYTKYANPVIGAFHILLLVGGLEHGSYFSIQSGMSSSQLTLTPSFFRGVG